LNPIKIYLAPTRLVKLKKCKNSNGEVFSHEQYVTVPSKKNQQTPIVSKTTGNSFIKQSDQYIKWKKIVIPIFDKEYERIALKGHNLPLIRCTVKIIFYFPNKIPRDVTNKGEAIMDALVSSRIIYDDKMQVSNKVYYEGYICKNQPRTEIYIKPIEPNSPEYEIDKTDYDKFNRQKKKIEKMISDWRKS